ncbi:MAG: rRNA maturation RNase YbeY [Candidatus Izemoplasmataceae bacterium]|jgi:probable rRNA maturation factor
MINTINQANSESYELLVERVLKKAYKITKTKRNKTINIIFVSNDKIKELNMTYRNKSSITDVLTFPSDIESELGDVFIALYVAMDQAKEYGHSIDREIGFLCVHGFLHAIGYDHETESEADVMFALQNKILDKVKLYR